VGYLLQMSGAIVAAVLAWAGITGLLFLLPPAFALPTMFCGLVLFLIGAKLHIRWPVAVGGVLMLAGVFAAAALGTIR
jgi:hypothetical protein